MSWRKSGRSKYRTVRRTELVRTDCVSGAIYYCEEVGKRGGSWYGRIWFEYENWCGNEAQECCGSCSGFVELDYVDGLADEQDARTWCDAVSAHVAARIRPKEISDGVGF